MNRKQKKEIRQIVKKYGCERVPISMRAIGFMPAAIFTLFGVAVGEPGAAAAMGGALLIPQGLMEGFRLSGQKKAAQVHGAGQTVVASKYAHSVLEVMGEQLKESFLAVARAPHKERADVYKVFCAKADEIEMDIKTLSVDFNILSGGERRLGTKAFVPAIELEDGKVLTVTEALAEAERLANEAAPLAPEKLEDLVRKQAKEIESLKKKMNELGSPAGIPTLPKLRLQPPAPDA